MADEIEIVVTEDAKARFLYHDDLADLIPPGYVCPIRRASHVNPTDDGRWTADMQPALMLMSQEQLADFYGSAMAGGYSVSAARVILGPYATRADALAAEVSWLKRWAGV